MKRFTLNKTVLAVALIAMVITVGTTTFYFLDVREERREFRNLRDFGLIPGHSQAFTCVDTYLPAIRQQHDLAGLQAAFAKCQDAFVATDFRFKKLSEGLRFGAFMAVVASRFAPYGATKGLTEIPEILQADYTNCAPQSLLVAKAVNQVYPATTVRHVGIINKLLNHAVVVAKDDTGTLILDPTFSVITFADIDQVLQGAPVGLNAMVDYYRPDTKIEHKLDRVKQRYRAMLINGGIRKQDIVYDVVVTPAYYRKK